MKAYKASYKGICKDFKFEVGKTYKHVGEVIICESGFHFCKRAIDTLDYYGYNAGFVLFEVEAKAIYTSDNKSVTDKIKIIRRVPKKEYFKLLKIKLDKNNKICYQEYANGTKCWYKDGEWHREDGHAVEWADGSKYWYKDGQRHRENGPTIEWADGSKEWYLNGVHLTEKEFNEKMKKPVK